MSIFDRIAIPIRIIIYYLMFFIALSDVFLDSNADLIVCCCTLAAASACDVIICCRCGKKYQVLSLITISVLFAITTLLMLSKPQLNGLLGMWEFFLLLELYLMLCAFAPAICLKRGNDKRQIDPMLFQKARICALSMLGITLVYPPVHGLFYKSGLIITIAYSLGVTGFAIMGLKQTRR